MRGAYVLMICLLISFLSIDATAQRLTEWLSKGRDTSFSTYSDHKKNLKQYPYIKIVPDSPIAGVTEKRGLVYARVGKRDLHIDSFIPDDGAKSRPAILIVHGGGWRSGDRSQHIPLAQHLAANGIACFTVEYRLSTEAFYPAAVYDVKTALRWMHANAAKYHLNPKQFIILGFSAGGQLAALAGLTPGLAKFEKGEGNEKYPSAVNAVIDIDGTLSFVHPEAWETQNQQTVNASAKWLGYPRTERLDLWKEASPLTYAAKNKLPFLFINSSVERMHAGRDDFKNMMDAKGVYVQVKSFPDSPHGFCLYRPWFEPTVNEILGFVKKVF